MAACFARFGRSKFPVVLFSVVPKRNASQSQILVSERRPSEGIYLMSLNKPPVNSLNLDFLTEFNINLEKLENSKDCRAVIITSNIANVFSGGLDIMEMYKPNVERLGTFWRSVQQFWLSLYGSKLITCAAINGAAPAGGCAMAMSCDIRLIVPKTKIGLNETQLGIVAPFWFRDTMLNTIGHRQSERALEQGYMFSSEEALAVGLVDRIVDSDKLLTEAENELSRWLKVPVAARQITKNELRLATLDKLLRKRDEDVENFIKFIQHASVQKTLGYYLESLKKK